MTFIDLVLAGKASLEDIDDWVRRWHCGETLLELRDWLGMTEQQYGLWLKASEAVTLMCGEVRHDV